MVNPFQQVRRPAQGARHGAENLGRLSAIQGGLQTLSRLRRVLLYPRQRQHGRRQGENHFVQAAVAARAGQVVYAFSHLDGVSRGAAQHLVHVGDDRLDGQAHRRRRVHNGAGQGLRFRLGLHEGP